MIGLVLQYLTLLSLLVYFYRNIKIINQSTGIRTMCVASLIGMFILIPGFLGTLPWILSGATIGAVERFKKEKRIEKSPE